MHDNAPSHGAHYTWEALTKFGFKEACLMLWPACSPDLNPIENVWSILKHKIYEDGKQFKAAQLLCRQRLRSLLTIIASMFNPRERFDFN